MATESCSKSKRIKQEEGEDRISALSNDIVHQILSFLPIKTVAQTSVLSKRWRSIWYTFPDLDFTTVVSLTKYADRRGPLFAAKTAEDVDRITRLLFRKKKENSILRVFRIKTVLSFSRLRRLIESAVDFGVQELDIDVNTSNYFNFPSIVLQNKDLRSFGLKSGHREIKLPSVELLQQGFRSLTALSLARADFRDDTSFVNLFTEPSFHSLRKLALEHCIGLKHLKIQLKNLRDLTVLSQKSVVKMEITSENLVKLVVQSSFDGKKHVQVMISTPSLKVLNWRKNDIVQEWIIEELTSLEEVVLGEYTGVDSSRLSDFIAGISHCRSLTIDRSYIPIVPSHRPFQKLHSLSIELNYGLTTKQTLAFLLRSSPELQTLVIKSCRSWGPERSSSWESESLGPCLHHLMTVRIHEFTWGADDVDFVGFILKNAGALREVELQARYTSEKVRQEMMRFCHCSPNAVIRFNCPETPMTVVLGEISKGLSKMNETLDKILEKLEKFES